MKWILLKVDKYLRYYLIIYVIKDSNSNSHFALRPESSENIPILLQGADPYFSNQNDLRNPKMGSKQSIIGATQ